jgi:hypothetical protein
MRGVVDQQAGRREAGQAIENPLRAIRIAQLGAHDGGIADLAGQPLGFSDER